mmetsp:Transcript_20200/g.42429  ORF Transcript_20200/g.42429 Transcript_20200/m.42429 type:complete len:311 (-) Transcript_20200:160-1092(-)
MVTSMLGKSVIAIAAIRTCSSAFVTVAPRAISTTAVRSSLINDHAGPIITPTYLSKSKSSLPSLHGGGSLRALSSSATTTSPLVVCGPSGVGKGTIIARFMEKNSAEDSPLPKFVFSVSHTTRQPRPGEVNGVHYHFVTRDFMQDKIESGSFFIEHAEVHGNMYGTSFQAIFDVSNADSCCLLDIDVEGVRSIKEFQTKQQQEEESKLSPGKETSTQQLVASEGDELPSLDARFIFIAPPSIDVLKERLTGRGTETPETLERRFRNAQAELDYGMTPGNFDAIVVNDDLDQACADFEKVVEDMYVSKVDS